jgi:hypothetical protein
MIRPSEEVSDPSAVLNSPILTLKLQARSRSNSSKPSSVAIDFFLDRKMKAYLLTTSVIFGLITAAHILRLFYEPHLAKEVAFNLLTLLAAGLCVWGLRLFLRPPR